MRLLIGLLLLGANLTPGHVLAADAAATEAILYKNPSCNCCEGYADYLRENGFSVTVQPTHDLVLTSRQAGVPEDLDGCHLTKIGGYAIVGHVPVEFVNRLLAEHPKIIGISIPGMPVGLPGMEGPKTGSIAIYEISNGTPAVYGAVE